MFTSEFGLALLFVSLFLFFLFCKTGCFVPTNSCGSLFPFQHNMYVFLLQKTTVARSARNAFADWNSRSTASVIMVRTHGLIYPSVYYNACTICFVFLQLIHFLNRIQIVQRPNTAVYINVYLCQSRRKSAMIIQQIIAEITMLHVEWIKRMWWQLGSEGCK